MKTIPCLIIATLLSVLSSRAEAPIRDIQFHVYAQHRLPEIHYHPMDPSVLAPSLQEQPPVPIKAHPLKQTGPFHFTGGNQIEFFAPATRRVLARSSIPRTSDKWLLIFLTNPKHKTAPEKHLKYLVYPFDSKATQFPGDSLIFVNFSGHKIEGLVDRKAIQITHGPSKAIPIDSRTPINLLIPGPNGRKLLPAHSKTYTFAPNRRYLLLLFPPVLSGSAQLDARLLTYRNPQQ